MKPHTTTDAAGRLTRLSGHAMAVEATRHEDGSWSVLIDAEDGTHAAFVAELDLYQQPPSTETVITTEDPFYPRLCLIEGERP